MRAAIHVLPACLPLQNLTVFVLDVSMNVPLVTPFYGGMYYIWSAFGMAGVWMFSNGFFLVLPFVIWVRLRCASTSRRLACGWLLICRPQCTLLQICAAVQGCSVGCRNPSCMRLVALAAPNVFVRLYKPAYLLD